MGLLSHRKATKIKRHNVLKKDLEPLIEKYSPSKLKKVMQKSDGLSPKAAEQLKIIYHTVILKGERKGKSIGKEGLFLRIVLSNLRRWQKEGNVKKEVLEYWVNNAKWFLVDTEVELKYRPSYINEYAKIYDKKVKKGFGFIDAYATLFIATTFSILETAGWAILYELNNRSFKFGIMEMVLLGMSPYLVKTIPEIYHSFNRVRISQHVNKIDKVMNKKKKRKR